MNPGGDYGKKELSPAMRNRFTEVWVDPLTDLDDLTAVVKQKMEHETLLTLVQPLLNFVRWHNAALGERANLSLRDILSWSEFMRDVISAFR